MYVPDITTLEMALIKFLNFSNVVFFLIRLLAACLEFLILHGRVGIIASTFSLVMNLSFFDAFSGGRDRGRREMKSNIAFISLDVVYHVKFDIRLKVVFAIRNEFLASEVPYVGEAEKRCSWTKALSSDSSPYGFDTKSSIEHPRTTRK